MRKITITASALMAIAGLQITSAATINVDFSKATGDATGATPIVLNGFSFVGNNSKVTLTSNGFYTGGGSTADARHIYYTPSKNGTLTVKGSPSGDNTDRYIFVATAPGGDASASSVLGKVAIPTKGVAKTVSVELVAGTTYYICLQGNGTITGLSYVEAELPSADASKELTIKKGQKSVDVELTLNVGTYEFKADGYTIQVDGKDVTTYPVAKNGTKVKVTVMATTEVDKDTKVAFSYSISGEDLQAVKTVYTNKVAIVINKANVYTNDARLQEDATKASALMAKANNIGMDEYNEYVTTGKIATLDKEISELSAAITAHKAAYDGYVHAQEAYAILDTKKGDLETVYKKAIAEYDKLKDEDAKAAAKAAAKETYDRAVEQKDKFLAQFQKEYAEGNKTDLEGYKKEIDTRKETCIKSIEDAIEAIEKGDGNVSSHANVNIAIGDYTTLYNTQAQKLYTLLTGNKEDGETYNDMYIAALQELNAYIRIINNVKAKNEQYFSNKECSKTTQDELTAELETIKTGVKDKDGKVTLEPIANVYSKYDTKATTLRANYAAANADIKNNLTGYLNSQIVNFIGENRAEVKTQFNTAVENIKTSIKDVQAKVDEVNKDHIIAADEYYAGYTTAKEAIIKTINDLKGFADAAGSNVAKAVAEYDAWQTAVNALNDLQKKYDNTKNTVTKKVSDDGAYAQNAKFSVEYEKVIQKSINDLKTSANASFKADGTGTARTFNSGLASKVATVEKSITDYSDASTKTLAKYNEIAAAITSYNNALNGYDVKDKDGKVTSHVDGLKEVATNLDVTVDATTYPTTGKLEGKTYATVIKEIEEQISNLQKALTTAAAKNDKEHVAEMAKLKVIDGLVKTVGDYKDTYAANEKAWNAAQMKIAKKSMLDEAERRVGAIDTKNAVQNETYSDEYKTEGKLNGVKDTYELDTYGKSIDDQKVKDKDGKETTVKGLNTLLKECNAQVTAIDKQITDAKGYGDDKDAEAIALLSKVVTDLKTAENAYADLNKKAADVKKAYAAEKAMRKNLLETIAAKDGIDDQKAKVTYGSPNYFATEVSNVEKEITDVKSKIEGSFKNETLRADNKDSKYDNALTNISNKITNLQGLVKNEENNAAANAAFTKTYNDAKVSDALAKALAAVNGMEEDDAKTFFSGEYQSYVKEDNAIQNAQSTANAAQANALGTDKKTLPGALDQARYTDVSKNMTAMKPNLEKSLADNKKNIEALAGRIEANKKAKGAQDAAAKANDDLRNEVFGIITAAESSSYHQTALATLKSIDGDIAKYKEDVAAAYAKGTCDTDKNTLNANAESIKTRLNGLKDGWDGEYAKAVVTDNQVRKENFDVAYTKLTNTYSHEVNIVTELSKLSYAQDQSGVLGEVVGENGIYSYAAKMRELNSNASKAYAATTAPALFDAAESFKSDAEKMEAAILALSKKYADAVNDEAVKTYNVKKTAADKALADAKSEVKTVLGIDDTAAAKAFKDVNDDIAKATVDVTNLPTDFAITLDEKYIPTFDGIAAKIAADKEAAAVASYEARVKEYKALAASEAKAIAGFNGANGDLGEHSEDYATFVGNTVTAAETAWGKIKDGEKYANFADVKTLIDNFKNSISTVTINNKKVSGTAIYRQAYKDDATYHANDIAYADMQKEIAAAQTAIDKAKKFVGSLIVKNDANVVGKLNTAQSTLDIIADDAYYSHKDNQAKADLADVKKRCASIINDVNGVTDGQSGVLSVEKAQITVQVGFLRHDYNRATAAHIDDASIDAYKEVINGYDKENEKIWSEFNDGKKDANGKLIKATAEETRLAYIALEGKIAVTKAELAAKYDKDGNAAAEAKAAVEAEIATLTETYNALVAQLADCHAPVVEKYQPEVDAFKTAIDGLQKDLDAEVAANSILLYQDVNLTSAKNIAAMVERSNPDYSLAGDIALDEKPYDVSDAKYIELLAQNNKLAENLKKVMDESADYEFKEAADYNNDGNIITYREYKNAQINAYITENKTKLDDVIAKPGLLDANSKLTNDPSSVQKDINALEKDLAYNNVGMTFPTTADVDAIKKVIASKGYTDADRKMLDAKADSITKYTGYAATFNDNVYGVSALTVDYEVCGGYSAVDINGEEIKNENDRYFVYMEQYPTLITKAQELRQALATLAKDADEMSWIKGDVDHNGEVTVADYEAVRQIVLDNTKCAEGSAMFYAADVNNDGKINIGDVTSIANYIMTGKDRYFPETTYVATAMARAMSLGVPTYGTLNVTAEGSGLEQSVKVAVDSELGFVGGQFDVVLPAGVKLAGASSDSHDALVGEADGTARVLVSNLENTEITSGATFVELKVEVSSEYKGGAIEVTNAQFADAEGNVYSLAKASINNPTGLTNLTTTEKVQSKIYSVGGMLMNKMKSGLNIIVNSDGTTRKEIKK